MPLPVATAMARAARILQDEAASRWTWPELFQWANDAVREFAILKPSALATSKVLTLGAGTRQTLADPGMAILGVTRNIAAVGPPRVGGRSIVAISVVDMDASVPDWHDTTAYPASATVLHYIGITDEPRAFYVFPANTGAGMIEALVVDNPVDLALPGTPAVFASYSALNLPLDAVYQNAVVDFILYRAFQKEGEFAGSTARADMHHSAFANALGVKLQNEMTRNPNRALANRQPEAQG